ncbi:MAG: 3-oxoadipate enol-lactonase [Pseudonocardia sp.]|nr:3-oxoadipate enol-lactonase [Pseudonocardia sp.]
MRLHHRVDGPDDAPILVFGPSLGTDLGLFDAQVAAFSDRFRTVRYDLRGHGGSPVPSGDATMADLAGDVVELLDRLGIERAHYVGVSIGGAIGQQLAVHTDRLLSLAVLASAARFADPDSWGTRAATVREKGTEAMVASRVGTWFTHAFERRDPDEARRLLDMLRATSDEGYAACCAAIGGFDIRGDLSGVTVPTLAVAGAEDPATPPEFLRLIADSVPGARYAEVPDTAHLLNAEEPDQVNELLAGHLKEAAGR